VPEINLYDLSDLVRRAKDRPPSQRLGQWYMNVLHEMRPDLYKRVTATDADPFYDDKRIQKFLGWCAEHWWEDYNVDINIDISGLVLW